jgi:hypothetical protein
MFTKQLSNSIRALFSNIGELFKLQLQFYLLELRRNRKMLMLISALCITALVLTLGGVLLLLFGVASLLMHFGMSMPAALLTTALIAFAVTCLVGIWAFFAIRSRLQRFTAPTRELKLNIDCIRSQFVKSLSSRSSASAADLG